jgi:hypothetical protein
MQYKTIVLELLQQRPQMHDQLRKDRKLLTTMESHAKELKKNHEFWMEFLADVHPDRDQTQIASEALEIALKELEDHLPPASHPNDSETLSLDAAMAFILGHTSRG